MFSRAKRVAYWRGRQAMRFGLWYDFRNPPQWAQPFDRLYAETLEHIAEAERLGFDDIWTSEHHFTEDGYSPSLLPLCAAIAARTHRVQIGTNVLLLTLHNPIHVAEAGATVDILSSGRFIFGPAVGYKRDEFATFGIDYHRRGRLMDEALEIVRRCWTEERFSFHGRYFTFEDVRATPRPVQKPRPPIWVGAFSEPALRRAARMGDGLLIGGAGTRLIPAYLDALKAAGKSEHDAHVALTPRWGAVVDDPERAWAELGEKALYRARLYQRWFSDAGMNVAGATPPASVEDLRARNPELFVTPEQAVASLRRQLDGWPQVERIFWWAIFPGQLPAEALRSLELAAKHVLPAFAGKAAEDTASGPPQPSPRGVE